MLRSVAGYSSSCAVIAPDAAKFHTAALLTGFDSVVGQAWIPELSLRAKPNPSDRNPHSLPFAFNVEGRGEACVVSSLLRLNRLDRLDVKHLLLLFDFSSRVITLTGSDDQLAMARCFGLHSHNPEAAQSDWPRGMIADRVLMTNIAGDFCGDLIHILQ